MNPHVLWIQLTEKKGCTPHILQKGEESNESKHQASCDKVVWVEVPSCGLMAWCGCLSMGRVQTGGRVLLAELAVILAVMSSSSHTNAHRSTSAWRVLTRKKEPVHSTKAGVREGCVCVRWNTLGFAFEVQRYFFKGRPVRCHHLSALTGDVAGWPPWQPGAARVACFWAVPPLQWNRSAKQRGAKGCPREGLVRMTRSVHPEGCLMSLIKPLVPGFPPHAGMSALVQQLLAAVLLIPSWCGRVCPAPLLPRARADRWDAGWLCDKNPGGDSSWREKMGCHEHAHSQRRLLMTAVNGLCCVARGWAELSIPVTTVYTNSTSLFHGDFKMLWRGDKGCADLFCWIHW